MKKEERKVIIRDFLKLWESLADVLSLLVPKKKQLAAISRFRKLTTQPELYWPNLEEIQSEFARYDLRRFAQTVIQYRDTNPEHLDVQNDRGRLEYLCTFPKRMYDTYDNRHPKLDKDGKPMMDMHQFRGYTLKERQRNKTSHTEYSDAQVEMPPIDSKQFKNMYKKYEKEWKEKNGSN